VDINTLIGQYGLPLTMLIVVVAAFVRGDVTPGYVYKDALSQRDRALDVAERVTTVAEQAVPSTRTRVRS
jgi:ABC-type taurine transport system substrate-binding protein